MNIILCGYMGSGKSLTGKNLSNKMNLSWIDLDQKIQEKENLEISQIFRTKGEIYFRKIEMQVLSEIVKHQKNYVLALGGGTPCYGNNLNLIKAQPNTTLIYLKAELELLTERLFKERHKRPLIAKLKDKTTLNDYIRKHLFERQYYYFQADYKIDIEKRTPEEISNDIIKLLKD